MDNFELPSSSRATMSSATSFVLNLLSHVEVMSKKPQIDDELSHVLDEFLQKVQHSDRYLDNGIFNINFAEVALLLQNCSKLYGKKVDLAWDLIMSYQKEIIALEKESAKREQAEMLANERQARYKRKRKIEETREQTNVNELLQLSSNIQKSSVKPCDVLKKTWTYAQVKDRDYCNHLTIDGNCSKTIKYTTTSLIRTDSENVASFDKLKLNRVVFELSEEYREFVGGCLEKNPLNLAHFYETDHVVQNFIVNEHVTYIEVEKIHRDKYKNYYAEHLTTKANNASAETTNICPKRLMTHVKRLSEDVLQQYLKKDPALVSSAKIKRASSTAPSLGDSGFHDYTAEAEEDDLDGTLREDVTMLLSEDSADGALSEGLSRNFDDGVSMALTEDLVNAIENNNNTMVIDELCAAQSKENVRDVVGKEVVVVDVNENNTKTRKRKNVEENERSLKRQKTEIDDSLTIKRRSRRITYPKIRVTAPLNVFEEFVTKNYMMENEEGSALPIQIQNAASLDGVKETATTTTETQLENCEVALIIEEFETASLSDCDFNNELHSEEVNNNTEIATEPAAILSETIMKRLEAEKKQREKVDEWKSFITAKLNKLNEKSDFDIHYYGSKIMDNMSHGENKKFGDVVQGKNGTEVCRYFMATLQLACTENVAILNAKCGQIANDSLELKLLSRECYHENLANYMAPSEESFGERLAKARGHRR